MSTNLTKEDIRQEILRGGRDPLYFINNYVKISHPVKGVIPFKMYDFQEELIRNFNGNRFNVILKARQLGVSTIIAAYCAWLMLFFRDKNILVLATKFKTAANLVKKTKSMIQYLPDYIKLANIKIDNAASFELDNGSQIKPSTTSTDAGRSESLSLLIVDEAAHVAGLDELWAGIFPTLSTGGKCVIASTPYGVGSFFHKLYTLAESGANDFHPICLPWDVHPERDREWFDKETRNMSQREINQELLCSFNMSGETVFDGKSIQKIRNGLREPKYKTGFDRNFWIWEEYDSKNNYFIVADVARGDSTDYSVFHIFKTETMEIIAEYQGKIPPDIFSDFIFQVGKEYGNSMIVVENNTIGYAVVTKLIDMKYPNVFCSVKSTNEFVDWFALEHTSGAVPGFTVTQKTRPLVIAKFEEYVRNCIILINSVRLANEMDTFVWINGRPEAIRGYNDDLIMACAIGCWVKDTVLMANKKELEYQRVFLENISTSRKTFNSSLDLFGEGIRDQVIEFKKNIAEFPWIFVK